MKKMTAGNSVRLFTLVELLAVIGIIAVLAGILLPVLSLSRAKARAITCTSQLKQIGYALKIYENDFRRLMPTFFIWKGNWEGYIANPMTQRVSEVPVNWFLTNNGYVPNGATFFYCPACPLEEMQDEDLNGIRSSYAPNAGIFADGKSERYSNAALLADGYCEYRLRCRDNNYSFRFRHGKTARGAGGQIGQNTPTGSLSMLMCDGAVFTRDAADKKRICRELVLFKGNSFPMINYLQEDEYDHNSCQTP